ncbi:two-component regulator propeller domain-containing protein [Flammeovirga agarivorans]|uniref:histidine kinase n=1 Tax=Flammeovirga agarivorans TaxID=2726742 RepID=A0A7X8XXZ0_9BACT|nr:two-component regulator propeller domain-containing protein [Flammeovirga agarivorans]NLR93721.1 response regulator [Flammeovirga agarivorans]
MKFKLLLFYLLSIISIDTYAEQILDSYQFEYFNVSNGLPTNYTYKIRQDHNKLFWLATNSGLVVYDSKNFNVKRPSLRYTGLKNENISAVYLQNDSIIWVGTNSGGLSHYNSRLDYFKHYDNILTKKNRPINRITSITEDADGNLWLSTFYHGVVVFNKEKGIIKRFVENSKVLHLIKDTFGNIWFASRGKLYKYDPSEDRLISAGKVYGEVMELYYDAPRDQIIIGTAKGLYKMATTDMVIQSFPSDKTLDRMKGLNTIKVDQEGRIWVGSWTRGLFVSDREQKYFSKLPLIKDYETNSQYEAILDIFFDQDKNIWVGTANGGLVKLIHEHSIKNYHNTFTNNIGLSDNNILSIYKDNYGTLWCGTWSGGLSYLTKGSTLFQKYPDNKKEKVTKVIPWGDKIIYAGKKGIHIIDNTNNQKKYLGHFLRKFRMNSVLLDENEILYIGTQMNGLLVIDLKKDPNFEQPIIYTTKNSNLVNNRVSAIGKDRSKKVWIGSYGGLQIFDQDKSDFYNIYGHIKDEVKSSLVILSINLEKEGKLWLSTAQGLIKADISNGFKIEKVFTVDDGLNNDCIKGVTFDYNNRLWFSNTLGIGTISPNEKSIINFDREKRFNNVMNNDAIYNDGKKIYFGGTNGLYVLDLEKISLQPEVVPSILVTDFYVNQKRVEVQAERNGRILLEEEVNFEDNIHLFHNENTLSFKVVSPNYHANSTIFYQFRIRELDKNWIDNGDNQLINLINLKPSIYHLEIRSTYDRKNYSAIKTITFTIDPPLYLTWWAKLLYLSSLIVVIYLVLRFIILKSKLENDLKIEKINSEKDNELNESKLMFFTNISHELRTPLTLIISPLSEIMDMDLTPVMKNKVVSINNNAQRLLTLINNLLDFRKAENGMLQLNLREHNFERFIDKIFLNFKNHSESKSIQFDLEKKAKDFNLVFDHDKMEMVVCNLLTNAFKFTKLDGKVKMIISNNSDHVTLTVKDTGKGISTTEQEKIFNRYYQIKDVESINMMGTGLGLALTKKIVELHQGEISIRSEENKGTEFTVTIPHSLIENQSVKEVSSIKEEVSEKKTTITENTREKQSLLIVDDHEEIREYLEDIFKDRYQVTTAANGAEAKELAVKIIPDLILTDVMMPKMNGIDLCKILKDNISTAHIPVLLLTAKTDNKHEIEGLKSGADDYIRKPFDVKVLNTKVETQLRNRLKVQRYFQNKVRFEPNTNLNTENKDEKFLQDVSEFINTNLENESFSVETLAEQCCMSQSTLYRKLKGLTGMTIAGFIRSIRLKKASELLIEDDQKLYVIGSMVGINDYKYFKKEFTKQFGVSPKEYREKKKQEMLVMNS